MNERYLFRGKRLDDGEWEVGFRLAIDNGREFIIANGFAYKTSADVDAATHEINSATIGQCAGRRDKTKTLIFEGDIVNAYGRHCFVRFRAGCWELRSIDGKLIRYGTSEMLGDCNDEHLKVIGNIHDNPELMEVTT